MKTMKTGKSTETAETMESAEAMKSAETMESEKTPDPEKMAEDKEPKKPERKKRHLFLKVFGIILGVFLLTAVIITLIRSRSDFGNKLAQIDGVSSVERVWQILPTFNEKYLVTFTQPIDWEDPSKGTFEQRVEIGYQGGDNVSVYYVSGYILPDKMTGSQHYFRMDDRDELSRMYDGNYISFEYRFFGDSVPEGLSADSTELWEYLTVENAAKDFASVIEKLSPVLNGTKVFTGASKGGFTTNTMAYYYPELCDAYVAYVAPLCDGVEDPRMVSNVYETIGDEGYTKEEAADMRQTMLDFQLYCIENREELQEMYYQKALGSGCTFRDTMTKEILFDMCVLEYAIGYWQYGHSFDALKEMLELPETSEKEHEKKIKKICKDLAEIAGPENWSTSYFAVPYYIQALKEMGSYAYDYSYLREAVIEKFGEDRLAITEDMEEGILGRLMFTAEQQETFVYDESIREELIEWSETTDAHVIMIYGGCDTWYAVRIPETENPGVHLFVMAKGNHGSEIAGLSEEDNKECCGLLDSWLLPTEENN